MSFFLILIPLAGLMVLNLPFPRLMRKAAFGFALLLFVAQALLAALMPLEVWRRTAEPWTLLTPMPLLVDHLTIVLLVSIGLVSSAALLVGQSMLRGDNEKFNFINVLLIAFVGLNGCVLTTDLFSLYVFMEVAAVASFILIAIQKDPNGLEGAFKYIVLSAVASALMLSSVALLLMVSGNTSYTAIAQTLHSDSARGSFARIAVGLFLCGLFIKGGLMPFHGWVADAYSAAPAPVSVFLAGVVTKVSGLYPLIRLVTAVFGFSAPVVQILLLVGAISVVGGALAALGQRDFKRMLAYSSISQVGYIVLGLGCGTPLGVAGAVFHLFNHSIFKSQLFVNAAAVEQRLGTRDMEKMGGLSAKMPFTSTTSVLAFLSTAGVPPLAGFWSKLVIIIALWKSAHQTYAVVAVLASVLTLAYFLLMQRWVFFGKLGKGLENVKEARAGLVVPAVVLAALTVGVGLAFSFVLETFILPAAGMR